MKWAWLIGKVSGIKLYLHYSFFLIIAYLFLRDWQGAVPFGDQLWNLTLVMSVFGLVVLHELGHALMARRYGVETRYIVLLPIGGLAQLNRLPQDPFQEMAVAFAGPAVNLTLALFLMVPLFVFYDVSQLNDPTFLRYNLIALLVVMNLMLAVFNLIPAFPMDGGRILRAALSLRLDPVQSTRWAVYLGRIFAIALGVFALAFDPFLLLVAFFIWYAGKKEIDNAISQKRSEDIQVADIMDRRFVVLGPSDSVSAAAELMEGFAQGVIPVVVNKRRLVGLISQADISALMRGERDDLPLSEVMRRQFDGIEEGGLLDEALGIFHRSGLSSIPVMRGDRIEGLLHLSALENFWDVS